VEKYSKVKIKLSEVDSTVDNELVDGKLHAPVDLPRLCLKRRRLPQGSAFWGVIDEKFFSGEYRPFPRIVRGILHGNRKSRITFDR
jgi:hypothetical protein